MLALYSAKNNQWIIINEELNNSHLRDLLHDLKKYKNRLNSFDNENLPLRFGWLEIKRLEGKNKILSIYKM